MQCERAGLHMVPHGTVGSFFFVLRPVEVLRGARKAIWGDRISSVPPLTHLVLLCPNARATSKVFSSPAR